MGYGECTETVNSKIVVVEENKRKFIVNNENMLSVDVTRVDRCLIGDEHEKCDYALSFASGTTVQGRKVCFVELKGADVKKAASQLETTIRLLRSIFNNHEMECYIICSRVPSGGPGVQVLKQKFYKKTKCLLRVHCCSHEIRI